MHPSKLWEFDDYPQPDWFDPEDEPEDDPLPRDAEGKTITDPVSALRRGLASLQEDTVKQPSTQAQAREDCAAQAAEELARAFYADRKLKIESLPVAQQIQFHGVIAAGLDTLLREAVERA